MAKGTLPAQGKVVHRPLRVGAVEGIGGYLDRPQQVLFGSDWLGRWQLTGSCRLREISRYR